MNLDDKLDLLTDAARFDLCNSFSQKGKRYTPQRATWAEADDTNDNRPKPLFRALMSSACTWNCAYCPLRTANDTPRASLEPEELARAFLPRYEAGAVQGLFLSTAVEGGVNQAVDRMLDGVELLRTHHGFEGYVHVKLLPGTRPDGVERAARLANRVSLNLEAPSAEHLARVSPERDWKVDLIERLRWAREWQQSTAHSGAPLLSSGLATQFVVGAAGESDRDLLGTGSWLYNEFGLRRVYFGAFRPVLGTPLEEAAPTPQVRVQRIQQADWLVRNYGFGTYELPFDDGGDLPLHVDPKIAWALAHPERFPVELNTASEETLLRVPGLGPLSVRRILRLRRLHPFREPAHLAALGATARRAQDFVTLDGRFFGRNATQLRQAFAPRPQLLVEQLSLF
ncbi:MAG: radical SAM protein [Chloroflexaceae bacterium]|jgi:predicted DNA-binding helix-hairpin-helix protein|nr:radical SAM protein [Chloroflexaceae bacterium]